MSTGLHTVTRSSEKLAMILGPDAPVPPHPSLWDVFSPEGAWLSTIEYPARFRVLEIGDSYVIGVARDDLDVEAVQVWGLKRVR